MQIETRTLRRRSSCPVAGIAIAGVAIIAGIIAFIPHPT